MNTLFSVTSDGVITVDTSKIKESFQEAYKGALGSDLNLEDSTVQGQLILNDTENLTTTMNEVVTMANSFSVYTAKGKALDVAAAYFGYYRKSGRKTVVSATLTGAVGTIIPTGSIASNGENEFVSLNKVTIPQSGSITVQFQAKDIGAINCAAGTLTTIVTPVTGWDSVNNELGGIVGALEENDNIFRQRITANWLNIRAKTILGALIDNVAQLADVVSVLGRENYTDESIKIDDETLAPHSAYLCVLGGKDADIAEIMAKFKTVGAGVNGDTDISYYDEVAKFTYNYKIRRPTFRPITIKVTYSENSYTPADVEDIIENILTQYIADNPFQIGQVISSVVLSQALDSFNQADLLNLQVANGPNYVDYLQMQIDDVGVLHEIVFEKVS